MKFLNVFNEIEKGNYALTDEAIYGSIQNGDELIPLYGGNKDHVETDRRISITAKTKNGVQIKVFSGSGIIISLDGSAGSMTYKSGEKFALNHHAGFITLRNDIEKIVDLEYFSLFFQNHYRALGVSDGSKTLSLNQIYSEEIDFPSYELQIEVINSLKKIRKQITRLSTVKQKYFSLIDRELVFPYNNYQEKNVLLTNCIDYMSGNSALTEERNYMRIRNNGTAHILLTGATKKEPEQVILTDEDTMERFIDKAGLLITRKGKAGTIRYLSPGKYVINDDAYILYQRGDSKYSIDLKWLAIQHKEKFLNYASSSDNSTWNMTGFFEHTRIDIPHMGEQELVVKMYEQVEQKIKSIGDIEDRLNKLLSCEIRSA